MTLDKTLVYTFHYELSAIFHKKGILQNTQSSFDFGWIKKHRLLNRHTSNWTLFVVRNANVMVTVEIEWTYWVDYLKGIRYKLHIDRTIWHQANGKSPFWTSENTNTTLIYSVSKSVQLFCLFQNRCVNYLDFVCISVSSTKFVERRADIRQFLPSAPLHSLLFCGFLHLLHQASHINPDFVASVSLK